MKEILLSVVEHMNLREISKKLHVERNVSIHIKKF